MAQEYPDDPRNGRAAAALADLAEHVAALPLDDPRLTKVTAFTDRWDCDIFPLVEEVSRVGFDGRPVDLDREVDWIIDASIRSAEDLLEDAMN